MVHNSSTRCSSETFHKFQFIGTCGTCHTFNNQKTRDLFEKLHYKKCEMCKDKQTRECNQKIIKKYDT